jgi:hypothetical protein
VSGPPDPRAPTTLELELMRRAWQAGRAALRRELSAEVAPAATVDADWLRGRLAPSSDRMDPGQEAAVHRSVEVDQWLEERCAECGHERNEHLTTSLGTGAVSCAHVDGAMRCGCSRFVEPADAGADAAPAGHP